jgi:membrane protease YdiL (CAAX protease family)
MNEAKGFETRSLLLYLLIAFGWTWLLWLPSVIISVTDNKSLMYWMYDVEMTPGLGLIAIGGIFSTFGPLVAAFTVTGLIEGREGVRRFWRRFWDVRLPGRWLLVSFLLPFIIIAVPRLLVVPLGYPLQLAWASQPVLILGWLLSNFTRSGGMSEEFGWRGYALPRLQAWWNALVSSIVLGVIWTVWHLPLWFLAGSSQQGSSFWLFLTNLVLTSILYTWLYNNARGSILVAVVFHAISNTVAQMFPGSTSNLFYWVVLGLIVILVAATYGPSKLVREPRRPSSEQPALESQLVRTRARLDGN